jgi:CRISPR-associated protein Csb1
MSTLTQFDDLLKPDGPAALVLREWLMPVEGPDGVLFPATFAAGDGFPGGYNIDVDPETKKNVALIDSVGSQANRIEPIFKEEKYAKLVPQIKVKVSDEKEVTIFDAGHRAGDALLRCSSLDEELQAAFKEVLKGDATRLAKIAPTSLVFGVWDSRDTQAKLPRVLASTIRAFNVRRLTRGAVYIPPVDYSALDVFSEEDKAKAEGDRKSPLAQRGFVHNPASGSHGGVIADGGIRRDATLALAAIRLLHSGNNEEQTLKLRRYILGLALVAFTYNASGYLRQGCLLVLNPDQPRELVQVLPDGERKPFDLAHDDAIQFAAVAAEAFGVGESKTVPFEKKKAKDDVAKAKKAK